MAATERAWSRAARLLCTLAILWIDFKSADAVAVMSIDFGSEWLKVAIVKPGVPMEIVLNRESKRKTSSAVFLRDDERLFGDEAAAAGVRFPKNAYIYLQHVIGKQFDSPHVELYKKRFPYYDLVRDVVRGTVLFQHDSETTLSPEELLGMIFKHCQEIAEAYADHPIKDTVITVPAFFNQAERRAMIDSATLAGLKVLQLMNDNTAVALNYGVFRRAEFNGTATSVMFYDVGASSTTATIVSYQTTKVKEHGIAETVPQLTIRGVGYDPFLGGLEFDFRLRDHLAKRLKEQGKTKSDVTKSPRAMAKLLKEAKRVKKILSANTDHISQVEGLIDDIDFKAKVTRDEFEAMCADLFDRVRGPVDQALASSQMILNEIDQIILVGGGSHVPKLQEKLQEAVKRSELGKNINTDEAAAMGSVYVSAFLSKSFRVKKFVIKDANLFPIQVSFNRDHVDEDGTPSIRRVARTLFGQGNPFPLKKVMTFNRHTKDFFFNIDYGDVSFLSKNSQNALGPLNLSQVSLSRVEEVFSKHTDEDDEPKGIKAHFRMDGGGLLFLDKVEAVFERPPEEEKPQEEKSTFEKLSNTISNLFGSSDDSTTEAPTEPPTEPAEEVDSDDTSETEQPSSSKSKQADDETTDREDRTSDEEASTKEEEKKEETTSDRETESEATSEETDSKDGDGDEEAGDDQSEGEETADDEEETGEKTSDEEKESDKESETKDDDTTEAADAKLKDKATETDAKEDSETSNKTVDSTTVNATVNGTDSGAKNKTKKSAPKPTVVRENIEMNIVVLDLLLPTETHLADWKKRLEDLDHRDQEKREREQAKNSLESHIFETQDALYLDAVITVSTESERESVSKALSEASDWLYDEGDQTTADVYKDKLAELKKLSRGIFYRMKDMAGRPEAVNHLKQTLNLSEIFLVRILNVSEEEQIYTEVEIQTLANVTKDIKEWLFDMETKQNASNPTKDPILTINLIKEKGSKLDREIMYLINKAKWAPPLKPRTNTTKTNTTKTEETVIDYSTEPDAADSKPATEEKQTEESTTTEDQVTTETDESKPSESSQSDDEETLALPGTGGDESDSKTEESENGKEKTNGHGEL